MGMAMPLAAVVASQLLEQLALLTAEAGGQLHLDGELMVAAGDGVAQARHPLVLEREHRSGLGASWNLQGLMPVDGLHLDRVAEDGLQVAEAHLGVNGLAVAPQGAGGR